MSETMTKEGKTWTEARDAVLRKHHAEGLSSSLIAARMGLTRNSVIGRVHRLGIQRGGQGRTTQRKKRVLAPKAPLPATVKARPLPPTGYHKPARSHSPEPTVHRIDVLSLKDDMCRWPIGDPRDDDFEFCGAPRRAGCSYCEMHASKAFIRGSYIPRSLMERAA